MSVHVHAKRAACLLAAPCVVRLLMRHGTGVVPLRSSTAGTDLVPVFADHSILYSTAVLGRYTTLIRREGSARLNAASRSIPARAAVCTVRAIYVIVHSRVAKDPKGSGISRGMTRKLAGRPASMGRICTVYTYRLLPTHAAEAVTLCRRRTGWQLARRAGDAGRPTPQDAPQRGLGRLRSA